MVNKILSRMAMHITKMVRLQSRANKVEGIYLKNTGINVEEIENTKRKSLFPVEVYLLSVWACEKVEKVSKNVI